jgi:hypothetical protein
MKTNNQRGLVSLAILFACAFILLSACKKENNTAKEEDETLATATGRVMSANLLVPIAGATVACAAHQTVTNSNGEYTLSVPTGNQTLRIFTGNGQIFMTEIPINLTINEVLIIPDSTSALHQIGSMAYVPGMYDKIERIIIDSLGYTATMLQPSDLANIGLYFDYDALFLNCDNEPALNTTIYNNLAAFYLAGGSIYASDFAVEYLTGDGNPGPGLHNFDHRSYNTTSTCVSPLIGGFVADSALCTSKSGTSGMVANVKILDINIITALGKDSLDINYDLGGWELVHSVDAPFHTIMEKTTGYPFGAVAVKSDPYPGAGDIFFTTFHNEPQGVISPDVKNILQYFIMNL